MYTSMGVKIGVKTLVETSWKLRGISVEIYMNRSWIFTDVFCCIFAVLLGPCFFTKFSQSFHKVFTKFSQSFHEVFTEVFTEVFRVVFTDRHLNESEGAVSACSIPAPSIHSVGNKRLGIS